MMFAHVVAMFRERKTLSIDGESEHSVRLREELVAGPPNGGVRFPARGGRGPGGGAGFSAKQ